MTNKSPHGLATAQAVDPAVWVDRHADALFQYAMARLGSRHVAEDLVQDAFLAALRSNNFAGQSEERTWLIGILKHKVVDYLRRRDRERPASELQSEERREDLFDEKGGWRVQPAPWPVTRGDSLESKEFWEVFRHCLDRLPRKMQTAFSLREMDDCSTKDLCEILQVSPSNLGVLLYRARMALRRCLEINWFRAEKDEA
jgi:RNA polymerase sigma-70 factor (ECF subfamily)